jgi:cytoskeletal protein CcmA (bactofilin family)
VAKEEPKDLNLVGHGTTIEGKVKSQGGVRVDGRIIGEITAYENVAIGTSGEVEGNISAKNVTVGGKVRGSIIAQEKMVFLGQAVVQGDIRAAKLVIDEGAVFDGKCSMTSTSTRTDAKPVSGVSQQKS